MSNKKRNELDSIDKRKAAAKGLLYIKIYTRVLEELDRMKSDVKRENTT